MAEPRRAARPAGDLHCTTNTARWSPVLQTSPPNDHDELKRVVDASTAAVLLSPVDLAGDASPLSADFLATARKVCDEQDALLLFDERDFCVGSTGNLFSFESLLESETDFLVDGVICAAGLFAGLPGAVLLAGEHLTGQSTTTVERSRFPLLQTAIVTTLHEIHQRGILAQAGDRCIAFQMALAEAVVGFTFVRDVTTCGMSVGIVTDFDSDQIRCVAADKQLLVESAGDSTIWLQPPPSLGEEDQTLLVQRVTETLETLERLTATAVAESSGETA